MPHAKMVCRLLIRLIHRIPVALVAAALGMVAAVCHFAAVLVAVAG